MMAWRPTSFSAIPWAESDADVAMAITEFDHVGIEDGPFERLHTSHGAAGDGEQPVDAQVLDQVPLCVHHVLDGYHGKIKTVGFSRFRINR